MLRLSKVASAAVMPFVLGAAGCMHGGEKADEVMLGRVQLDKKQPLFTAQHNVEVAQTNLQIAERNVDEAKSFQSVARREHDAAKARVDAMQKAMVLGQTSGDERVAREAQSNGQLAGRELAAADAKVGYADRLLDLRSRQLDLARKNSEVAGLEVAIARAELLRSQGMAPQEDLGNLIQQRNDKRADIAGIEGRIASISNQVEQMRVAWRERRQTYNVAARSSSAPPVTAPTDHDRFQPAPMPSQTQDVVPPEPTPPPSQETPSPEDGPKE